MPNAALSREKIYKHTIFGLTVVFTKFILIYRRQSKTYYGIFNGIFQSNYDYCIISDIFESLPRNAGDTGILQRLQGLDSAGKSTREDLAGVKKVPSNWDEFHMLRIGQRLFSLVS